MLNLKNHVSRNGFDLSHRNIFSASVGELLPVSVIECLPGDNFKIKTSSFTRTVPVQTASFTRIKEYFDWFFVPYRLLNRSFNQDILQLQNENPISADGPTRAVKAQSLTPNTTLKDIVATLNKDDVLKATNFCGFSQSQLSSKLLTYLGYGNFIQYWADNKQQEPFAVSSLVSLFPLAAYQKIYMDFFRFTQWERNAPWTYNFDWLGRYQNSAYTSPTISYSTISDFDIANSIFTMRYCNYPKDLWHGLYPKSQYGDVATVSLDGSGVGKTDKSITRPSLSVMAGQSAMSLGSPLPDVGSGEFAVSAASGTAQGSLLKAIGPVNIPPLNLTIPSLKSSFDILQLRKAQALQRWSEITQSGSYDVTEQMEKHWGVKLAPQLSDKCRFVGSSQGTIVINEVVNQNLTTKDDIADIKGRGLGSQSDYAEFQTDEFGLLMCIYHAVPQIDYNLNRQSFATKRVRYSDFPIPEFDKLGLQAVYYEDFNNSAYLLHADPTVLMGYAPRYFEFKTNFDLVNGVFTTTRPDWVAQFTEQQIKNTMEVTSGHPSTLRVNANFFKVDPRLLDDIFGAEADASVNSDTFYVGADFDIKVVRNLDFDGMPY